MDFACRLMVCSIVRSTGFLKEDAHLLTLNAMLWRRSSTHGGVYDMSKNMNASRKPLIVGCMVVSKEYHMNYLGLYIMFKLCEVFLMHWSYQRSCYELGTGFESCWLWLPWETRSKRSKNRWYGARTGHCYRGFRWPSRPITCLKSGAVPSWTHLLIWRVYQCIAFVNEGSTGIFFICNSFVWFPIATCLILGRDSGL